MKLVLRRGLHGETVTQSDEIDVFDEDYDPLAIPTATLAPGIAFPHRSSR